ncbi:MAG: cell division protein ZapA [Novosphingobium sp.]
MSNVTLQVGGRSYIVACAAGEEDHVERLGQLIDSKARELGASSHNEVRLLLFAALLLADELTEVRGKGPAQATTAAPDHAEALEKLADRLENYAASLER